MNKLFGLFLLALACWAPGIANAAGCFWVGGTASWDGTNTGGGGTGGIKWASASGGASACAGGGTGGSPSTGDSATFDGSSGGGTVTVNTTVAITALTMGAFTGTLDFATNNNNITISSTNGFSNNGAGTRTLNMGNGTWTLSGASGNVWFQTGASNLTFNSNSSILQFTGTSPSSAKTVALGTFTYSTLTFGTSPAGYNITGSPTIATWNITAPTAVNLPTGTIVISNAMTIAGSSGNAVGFQGATFGTSSTLQLGAASTCSWCAFRDITFTTSSITATNSFDLGRNTLSGGGSISPPSGGGGGGGRIIGG